MKFNYIKLKLHNSKYYFKKNKKWKKFKIMKIY